MFDMLTGQYKNLASKGRYGDTMLAHINPLEAALLKSRGGAGTVNPQTGLREFFNLDPRTGWTDAPKQYEWLGGKNVREIVTEPFDRAFADIVQGGYGAQHITGYTLPTDDKKYAGIPLEAKYDPKGNFQFYTLQAGQYLTPDPSQPNIQSVPRLDAEGKVTDWGVVDVNEQDNGSFGSFVRGLAEDFGPMILAGLAAYGLSGSNILSGFGNAAGGVTGAAAEALGPYAAQAAGAYGGSAAAAAAAAGGSLTGIQAASAAQNAVNLGIPTGGGAVTPDQVAGMPTSEVTSLPADAAPTTTGGAPTTGPTMPDNAGGLFGGGSTALTGGVTPAITGGITASNIGQMASNFDLSSLGSVGSSILDFAKANPSIAGSLLGAVTSAIGSSNAPKTQTTTSSIDPEIKKEYLYNLQTAKEAAAGLQARKYAGFTPNYQLASQQVKDLGLGGKGQQTTDKAVELALKEAGFTPQQILAAQSNRQNIQNTSGQLGSQYMGAYYNPFEEQVVQGALGDIERSRQIQEQANMDQATRAKAFGGSRQGVVSGMTNEAALRQAGTTSGQLRQAGFNTAANLGQLDAARALQAQMANQGVDLTIEQANAQLRQQAALANQSAYAQGAMIRQSAIGQVGQLGAQQQNLGLAGANAVMEDQIRRQALAQARLDAQRNLAQERLGITSGALSLQPANVGGTTSQPLYNNTAGNLLSGGLTGAYIGSLLQPRTPTS